MRILTWNVWWRFGPDWQARQPRILRTLREADADLVALQETWGTSTSNQPAELAAELGHHSAYAAPSLPPAPDPPERPDQRDVTVGVGLVSRWPVIASETVTMPAEHRSPASVSLLVTVDHPDGPLRVIVACLEWEPEYESDRHAQAARLAELAGDPALDGPLPVVVAGDLNAAPDSPVLRPLREQLIDTWTAGDGDPAAVTLSSAHPQAAVEVAELIDQRIDYVLVRPGHQGQRVDVQRAVLTGEPVDGLYPSDHHAVVSDIEWDG